MEQIKSKFGKVPNIFATVGNSPASLKMLMEMFATLDEGALAGKVNEAIALRIGELNSCDYCRAAHTAKAKMLGLKADETLAFRAGDGGDPKTTAILSLATSLAEKRGHVGDEELQAARSAGVSDGEILETLAIVVLNLFTNYINAVVKTEVDFPAAPPSK
jgi:uncharacterized peroxidase-related enzyme